MADTIITNMKLVLADKLFPDQLMVEDLIEIDNEILEVMSISSDKTGDNYTIEAKDEYNEVKTQVYSFMEWIPLYVFIEED